MVKHLKYVCIGFTLAYGVSCPTPIDEETLDFITPSHFLFAVLFQCIQIYYDARYDPYCVAY